MQKKYIYFAAGAVILILGVSAYLAAKPPRRMSDIPGMSDIQKRPLVQNGIYQNKKYGFSIAIPEGFKVTENNPDEDTFVVLVETDKPEEKRSFQIFVMPFDEPGPVNKERILIDLPDAVVDDPREITLAGVPALVFWGSDESLGKTREVWFIHSGSMFQISSYASFDEELSKIMATFKFQ